MWTSNQQKELQMFNITNKMELQKAQLVIKFPFLPNKASANSLGLNHNIVSDGGVETIIIELSGEKQHMATKYFKCGP